VQRIREVSDKSPDTLRELVLTIAEEHGEPRENLQNMSQRYEWDPTCQSNVVVFDIQRNVAYSAPYAVCRTQTALKIDERYFKLEELMVK